MNLEEVSKHLSYVDSFILSKDEIKDYDLEKTLIKVQNKIREFKLARNRFTEGLHVRLTPNYEPIMESYSFHNSDPTSEVVRYTLDSEQEYNEFNATLKSLYDTMSKEEIAYINDCLICNKSEASLKEKFNLTRWGFNDIKNSSIIRFAIAFHLEVKKKY